MPPPSLFGERKTIEQVEEGSDLAPKFDADGMIPAVTTDFASGELLMHAYMNAEALTLTIQTGEAHYFSRSRQAIWHKGATSGLVQKIVELLIDDDQDCIWLRVDVAGGASCHVGYRSCFYRKDSRKFSARRWLTRTVSFHLNSRKQKRFLTPKKFTRACPIQPNCKPRDLDAPEV